MFDFPNSRTIFRLILNPERNRFPEFPNDIFHFPEFPNEKRPIPEFVVKVMNRDVSGSGSAWFQAHRKFSEQHIVDLFIVEPQPAKGRNLDYYFLTEFLVENSPTSPSPLGRGFSHRVNFPESLCQGVFFRHGPLSHLNFSGCSLVPMRYLGALVPGPNKNLGNGLGSMCNSPWSLAPFG